ncbi:MAG: hypothetical protein O2931_02970 [Planctomycetota bacterium]|nr:hypothetical protein [Planctomycetota bacterium]MDA1177739.1 hypothetical protein [Planctomycetota bacterium]
MKRVAQGVVYDATQQPGEHQVAFFDAICRLGNGDWICSFTIGAKKHDPAGTLALYRLRRDAADTWCKIPTTFSGTYCGTPGSLAGAEIVETSPGRLLLFTTWFDRSDPLRPVFDPVTEGLLPSRLLMSRSEDGGISWGEWQELLTPGLTGCALTGPVLQWPDGTIACAWESYKRYDDPEPGRHAGWLSVSRDEGFSFEAPRLVARDPQHERYYWDQRLCTSTAHHGYIAMFWTHDRARQADLNVHLTHGTIDGAGGAFGPIDDTGLSGQIASPLLWHDGRILAFIVDRQRPGTLTLWQSCDGGRSWPVEDACIVHSQEELAATTQGRDQIDFKAYWEDMIKWSFGHPAIRAWDDQHVLVTYYAGSPNCMSVHWARVAVG